MPGTFHPTSPRHSRQGPAGPTRVFLRLGLCAWVSLGFMCEEDRTRIPTLPPAILEDIHLLSLDTLTGAPAVSLSWSYPSGAKVSRFEVYQGFRSDSLGSPVLLGVGPEETQAHLPLPDSTRPFKIFYGIRAVFVEPTGQKLYGDSVPVDSITLTRLPEIDHPASGSVLHDRQMDLTVRVNSDFGIVLRQALYGKSGRDWRLLIDTCLPRNYCGVPVFGPTTRNDTLILEGPPRGDTLSLMYCVEGTESYENRRTGLIQSVGCSRFFLTAP